MNVPLDEAFRSMPSPCTGVCTLGQDGLCIGCRRSGAEIARWSRMNDEERLHLMESVLPGRAGARGGFDAALPEHDALYRALRPLAEAPRDGGWNHEEMAGLLPEVELREAAVLVGMVPRGDATAVLLTRRTDSLRKHSGQVSFPGGGIDAADADAVAAAIRESQEEIALQPAQIQPMGFLDPFVTVSGYRVVPVVAALDPGYVARPNPAEVAEVFEVPLQYLMAEENLRRLEIDYKGRRRVVLEYGWPGQRIWGATAAILSNLRQRLERYG